MTALFVQEKNSIFTVRMEDGAELSFRPDYIEDAVSSGAAGEDSGALLAALKNGRPLEPDEEAALVFAGACFEAEKAAVKLAARAEQCSAGLAVKLYQRGYKPAAAAAAIRRLKQSGAVNDARYAELWLDARASRSATPPKKLLALIRAKGVDARTAGSALRKVLSGGTEAALLRRFLKGRSVKEAGGRAALRCEGFSACAVEDAE
ncbi:MAG: RecX family transcriptional regulator [Spirochaetaceae bacterium]|jgi:SOS response regulatory protein OraA/RecX|nr:RecX family transcriptional regulator [Spirochaetaceae bacterium]